VLAHIALSWMMNPATAAYRSIGHDPSPFILSGLLAQCLLHL